MTGNLLGEPVLPFVKEEVERRQKVYGKGIDGSEQRTTAELLYMNNRNSWIKLASSVSIDDINRLPKNLIDKDKFKGLNLAKKAILFNSLSELDHTDSYRFRAGVGKSNELFSMGDISFNSTGPGLSDMSVDVGSPPLYGLGGNEQGIVPAPGITGVSVETRNNGSIKTATVNIVAYNRFQFEIIELLYLRLGFTVMLEYGWDKYIDDNGNLQDTGNTVIEDSFFKEDGVGQFTMLNKINEFKEKYSGNYDGFFGRIKNFAWDFGTDGTYTIKIDLITLGDIVESLKVNVSPTAEQKKNLDASAKEVKKFGEAKDSIILANRNNSKLSAYLYDTIGSTKFDSTDYFNMAVEVNANDSGYAYKEKLDLNYNYYVRFGELIKLIQQYIIPKINPSDEALKFEEGNVDTTLINYTPNLVSFDPRICIFNYQDGAINQDDITDIYVPQYTKSLVSALAQKGTGNKKEDSSAGNTDVASSAADNETPDYGTITVKQKGTIAVSTNRNKKSKDVDATYTAKILKVEGNTITHQDKNGKPITREYDLTTGVATGKDSNTQGGNNYTITYSITDLATFDKAVGGDSSKSAIAANSVVYLKLYNIYVNYACIFEQITKNTDKNGNTSVFKFLQGICNAINSSFANVTEITPQIKDDKIITFVERKPPMGLLKNLDAFEGVRSGESVTLQVYGFDQGRRESNFLQQIKFNTKITPELGNMISIGATAAGTTPGEEATGISKWNKGLRDRFQLSVSLNDKVPTNTKSKTNEDTIAAEQEKVDAAQQSETGEKVTYNGKNEEFKKKVNPSTGVIKALKSSFNITFDVPIGNGTRYEDVFSDSEGTDIKKFEGQSKLASGAKKQRIRGQGYIRITIDKDGALVKPSPVIKKYDTYGDGLHLEDLPNAYINGYNNKKSGKNAVGYLILKKADDNYKAHYAMSGETKKNVPINDSGETGRQYQHSYSLVHIGKKDEEFKLIQDKILEKLTEAYAVPAVNADEKSAAEIQAEADKKVLDDFKSVVGGNYSAYLAQMFGGKPTLAEGETSSVSTISKRLTQYFPNKNSEYVGMGKSAYKTYLEKYFGKNYSETGHPSSQIGFIPVEFTMDMDGIAGWRIYNKINIQQQFLPKQYKEALEFLITGVSHDIGPDGWTTKLKTLSTSNIDAPPTIKRNPAPKVSATSGGGGGGGGDFDPGGRYTKNRSGGNAAVHNGVPVENGFLHRVKGLLVHDKELQARCIMANQTDKYRLRLHKDAMPHFKNLLNAYESAIASDGKTFLQKYGKLKINSCYRCIEVTPSGRKAAAPGKSRHGLGIAIDLSQPAKYEEVHSWFVANAPELGWMRIRIFGDPPINETWHWECQFMGPYKKMPSSSFVESNIKKNGKNGRKQYTVSPQKCTGMEKIKSSYVVDASVFEKQKSIQNAGVYS